jgi:predicted nucleic acid-binding protein
MLQVYLVDTNVVSEVRKKGRANKGVRAFFRRAAKDETDLYLSVVTVGELRRGIEMIRHRGDVPQAALLEAWLETVLEEFANHILPVDHDVAQLWGRLRVPRAEHSIDKVIAATALIHDLTVVTRNQDDFSATGVRLLNPFD